MNPFLDHRMDADEYDRARPYFHGEVYDLEQLLRHLKTQSNVRIALRSEPEEATAWLRSTLEPGAGTGSRDQEDDIA